MANWASRASGILSIAAGIMGIAVWVFSSFVSGERNSLVQERLELSNSQMVKIYTTFKDQNDNIISRIRALEQHISSISNIPKEDTIYIELQKVNTSVNNLISREQKIEAVILENPAKALETPLLRRDLDNVKESQQAALVSLKDSVDRIYDLNKWLLGAMAVSIVTLAAGNFLKSKETKP